MRTADRDTANMQEAVAVKYLSAIIAWPWRFWTPQHVGAVHAPRPATLPPVGVDFQADFAGNVVGRGYPSGRYAPPLLPVKGYQSGKSSSTASVL
jgi:hypothetical protein